MVALQERPSIIFETVGGQGFGPFDVWIWLSFTHRMNKIRLHVIKATARLLIVLFLRMGNLKVAPNFFLGLSLTNQLRYHAALLNIAEYKRTHPKPSSSSFMKIAWVAGLKALLDLLMKAQNAREQRVAATVRK